MKGKGLFDSGSSFLARGDYGERGGGGRGGLYLSNFVSHNLCGSPNKLAEKKQSKV